MKHIFFLFISFYFLFVGCQSNEHGNDVQNEEDQANKKSILDGSFCANVSYFNPSTNFESMYKLKVSVSNNYLNKIYFSNGGWLDESEFISKEIIENETTIETKNGRFFKIKINFSIK